MNRSHCTGLLLSSRVLAATLCSMLFLGTGCGISGRWAGGDLKPEMAREQFNLLRPAGETANFTHAEVRLQQDGTFTSELNYGGKMSTQSGTWQVKGQQLTLTDVKGNSQVFLIKSPDAQTLKLISGIKGSDVTLTLKKK